MKRGGKIEERVSEFTSLRNSFPSFPSLPSKMVVTRSTSPLLSQPFQTTFNIPVPPKDPLRTEVNQTIEVDQQEFENEIRIAEKVFSGFKNHVDEYFEYDLNYTTNPWKEPSQGLKAAVTALIPYLNKVPNVCAVRAIKLYSGIKLVPDAQYDPHVYEDTDWDKNVEVFNHVYMMRGYKNADAFFTDLKQKYIRMYNARRL